MRGFSLRKVILLIIIGLGIFLRTAEYFQARSLWYDEAVVGHKIRNSTFLELIDSKDISKASPYAPGYLWMNKIIVAALGDSELTQRAYSFFFGILALVIFYFAARELLPPGACLIAVGLLAFSPNIIFYCSEAKPYSGDLFFSTLLLWLFLKLPDWHQEPRRFFLFCAIAAGIAWFSLSAVWVLLGVGSGLLIYYSLAGQNFKRGGPLIFMGFGLTSFLFCYFLITRHFLGSAGLAQYWRAEAVSNYFGNIFQAIKAHTLLYMYANFGMELSWHYFLIFFAVSGLGLIFSDRRVALIAAGPIAGTLFAALLGIYPFAGRLLIFLASFVMLFMLGPVLAMEKKFKGRLSRRLSVCSLGVFLLLPGLALSWEQLLSRSCPEDMKAAMAYVQTHRQDGDLLYVFERSAPAFRYYQERFGFEDEDVMIGVYSPEYLEGFKEDARAINAKGRRRVWGIFTHRHKDVELRHLFKAIGPMENLIEKKIFYHYPAPPPDFHLSPVSAEVYLYRTQASGE